MSSTTHITNVLHAQIPDTNEPSGVSQLAVLRAPLTEALNEVDGLLYAHTPITTAKQFETLERKIVTTTDRVAGLLIGYRLQRAIEADAVTREVRKLVQASPKKLKSQGTRTVPIQPLRGTRW